jgi:cell division septation protein DedD
MADEGFHEIQLNGKQLVFLFMAATVVSVVVFLLGVMVGRNVRQPAAQIAASAPDSSLDPTAEPTADPGATAQSAATGTTSDRTPLSAQESLSYAERLEAPDPAEETLAEAAAAAAAVPAPKPAAVAAPAPDTARETARTEPPAAAAKTAPIAAANVTPPASSPAPAVQNASVTEPAGNGWVVQVMAAVKREEAESLARRLSAKGYPAFVSVGDVKVPAKYRVRVGKYSDKREAEAVDSRLQKQEQFKTWLVPPTR